MKLIVRAMEEGAPRRMRDLRGLARSRARGRGCLHGALRSLRPYAKPRVHDLPSRCHDAPANEPGYHRPDAFV